MYFFNAALNFQSTMAHKTHNDLYFERLVLKFRCFPKVAANKIYLHKLRKYYSFFLSNYYYYYIFIDYAIKD